MNAAREPLAIRAAIVALLSAVLQVSVAFGAPLSADQQGALSTLINVGSVAVLVILTRGKVTPVDDPHVPGSVVLPNELGLQPNGDLAPGVD